MTIKTTIKYSLPASVVSKLRYSYNSALDFIDLIRGKRDPLTPPRRITFIGGGDFKKIGNDFLKYFTELAELKPSEHVLDVGSGIGRMAVPLTQYLDKKGSYDGFDIAYDGIKWCTDNITSRYPNFSFQRVDIYNKTYNPKGRLKASEFTFPFSDDSFDFIFMTSVFTHLLSEDMEHYLSETNRVLKKGGRCLITFFILNEESLKLIEEKKSTLDFKYLYSSYGVVNKNIPEDAVAYKEDFVQKCFKKYGLKVKEPIYWGSWCGREKFHDYQDIVIALKE